MLRVAVVDYGVGNVDSIIRAIEKCGGEAFSADCPEKIQNSTHIILPGVGSFGAAMENLRQRNLINACRTEALEKKKPLLGICLGMQLLATSGEENGSHSGLGLIPGKVCKLSINQKIERLPHIGWNEVHYRLEKNREDNIFRDIRSGEDFYFVHSYHYLCEDEYVLSKTPYGGGFISAIKNNNIIGVQFHPEKSQRAGMQFLKNFLDMGSSC